VPRRSPPARARTVRAVHPGPTRRYAALISVHARACIDLTALCPASIAKPIGRGRENACCGCSGRAGSFGDCNRGLALRVGRALFSAECVVANFCVSPRARSRLVASQVSRAGTCVSAWSRHAQMSAKLPMNGVETQEPPVRVPDPIVSITGSVEAARRADSERAPRSTRFRGSRSHGGEAWTPPGGIFQRSHVLPRQIVASSLSGARAVLEEPVGVLITRRDRGQRRNYTDDTKIRMPGRDMAIC